MTRLLCVPVSLLLLAAAAQPANAQQTAPPALETIRNFQTVSGDLSSAGQIGYEQIPLLRQEGYQVVVNLAAADRDRNGEEGFLVARSGLTYIHIPVDWEQPQVSDVEMFFDVMRANQGRKILVHCIANMRASAFVYMYRTLVEGVPEVEARRTMNEIWDPADQQPWADLIESVMSTHRDGE